MRPDRPRRETGASALQRALAGESAANLGRLGRAVEGALTRLRDAPEPLQLTNARGAPTYSLRIATSGSARDARRAGT